MISKQLDMTRVLYEDGKVTPCIVCSGCGADVRPEDIYCRMCGGKFTDGRRPTQEELEDIFREENA